MGEKSKKWGEAYNFFFYHVQPTIVSHSLSTIYSLFPLTFFSLFIIFSSFFVHNFINLLFIQLIYF